MSKEITLKTLSEDIASLARMTQQGFLEVNDRFKQVDQRFGQMDKRFDRLEARVDEMAKDIVIIKQDIVVIKQDIVNIKADIRAIKVRITKIETDLVDERTRSMEDDSAIAAQILELEKENEWIKNEIKKLKLRQGILN